MDIYKVKILYNTLKYLKFIQIYYRFYYLLRNKFFASEPKKIKTPPSIPIQWHGGVSYSNRYFKNNKFEFLNIKHDFSNKIDWNHDQYGKLWTYNLNYFDFLNQHKVTKEEGLLLIQNYIENDTQLKDGKEPYPTSLRLINWVKFLSKNNIKEAQIDDVLYHHTRTLICNLEYHLLANHLLENAFALFFGAYYFQDDQIYSKSKKLLISQLDEQILEDGAHYEISAMYHQILFHRLLDSIQLIVLNPNWKEDNLQEFLVKKANLMKSWLAKVTYKNGDIPMVGDAAFGTAPSSKELLDYADVLQINASNINLTASGYRKAIGDNFELFMDVGNIQPSYQPGHTHSDTFHFDLYKDELPVFIDPGVSTYEKNSQRQQERSTSFHNTVMINNENQTQVWGGFRVGKRARVINIIEEKNKITAEHDGYKKLSYIHRRTFDWSNEKTILIEDDTLISTNYNAIASFHLHSNIDKPFINEDMVHLKQQNIFIYFEGHSKIQIENYQLPIGFNKFHNAYKIIVTFDRNLLTRINL